MHSSIRPPIQLVYAHDGALANHFFAPFWAIVSEAIGRFGSVAELFVGVPLLGRIAHWPLDHQLLVFLLLALLCVCLFIG